MEEKKQIRVRLVAVVSVVIIVILIMLFGVVYHIGIVKNNEKIAELENSYKENIENLENKINELSKDKEDDDANNEINSNVDDNSSLNQIKLGKYYIQSSETPLDEGVDTSDCNISFLENNKFEAYIGWGHSISGTYSISDNNIIKCLINSFKGELSPEQNTYAEISFKINDNTEIEVINASETYNIKVTSIDNDGNTIITNEDKEMLLSIKKGIKFVLEEKE